MQCVYLTTHSQLKAFKTRLLDGAYVDGKPIGHTIHELVLAFDDESYEEEADTPYTDVEAALIFIITQTPKLQTYDVSGEVPDTGIALLSCLSTISAANLITLDINIRSDEDGVFPVINSLRRLRKLFLRVLSSVREWIHDAARPLSIDGLKDVLWQFSTHSDDFLAFLAECWFGAEGDFELHMPKLQPEKASMLLPLFARHAFTSIRLDLPSPAILPLASTIVNAQFLLLVNSTPPAGVLPTLPAQLELCYPPTNQVDQEVFWDFLARPSVAPVSRRQAHRTIIYISYRQQYFDWLGHIDSNYAVFIGRLLRIAVGLYNCNIIIKDLRDRDVTSLTQDGFLL
jgi:hypothetical protein